MENVMPEIGDRRVLKPSRWKWFLIAMCGLAFAVTGVFLVLDGEGLMGWFVTGFFGLVGVIGVAQLLGTWSYLELRADGFEAKSLGRGFGAKWEDCSEFGVGRVGYNSMVMFSRREDEGKVLAGATSSIFGASGALPDTYGMKPVDLAALMNAYRAKALGLEGRT